MKILRELMTRLIVVIGAILFFSPVHISAQKNIIKVKLIKRAKVNKSIYQKLSSSSDGKGLHLLGDGTIAPQKGFLLFEINGTSSYLNVATNDPPSEWKGVSEVQVKDDIFRLPFSDGGYLWSTCICLNVNDACKLSVSGGNGGGLEWTCEGPACCTQKWGYVDKDGKGTVFE